MHLKDYYIILEIETSATLPEIKKAYRRLALLYHPDKNHNDPYAAAKFTEIKEAYDVLTNPGKKECYLQLRWYNKSAGKRKTQGLITPVNILKQVLELDKYVSTLDTHRMDKQGLYDYICEIISTDAIGKLNSFNENDVNKEIVSRLLNCASSLRPMAAIGLKERLLQIKTDDASVQKINSYINNIYNSQRWEKSRVWIILLIVICLTLLIFVIGK